MIKNKSIYVLHEYGAPTHYNALVELGNKTGFTVKFRVFSLRAILSKFYHRKFAEGFESLLFMLSLPWRKQSKIILGIAPFNWRLKPLSCILKKHQVYYHTSYTHWDGSIMAHPTTSNSLISFWCNYVQYHVGHIFAVSKKTHDELIKNGYSTDDKISIVNHSFNKEITPQPHVKDNSFIFVGRLQDAKGIRELLAIFENRPTATLTIAGSGELDTLVQEYASRCKNINFLGYINGLEKLIPVYQRHSFVIMNSQRTKTWEELFGIAIIEGMACGCVPITTDHPGPMEIISHGINGFISPEKEIAHSIDQAIAMDDVTYQTMRDRTIKTGQSYHVTNMADRWSKILD